MFRNAPPPGRSAVALRRWRNWLLRRSGSIVGRLVGSGASFPRLSNWHAIAASTTVALVITIVSGIPGAGKSTVSRLLAEQWPRSVHLEGDRVGAEFVIRGLVNPGEEPAAEAEAQLLLRRRNIAMLADSFRSAGFEAVIDDVILWPGGLDLYLDLLRSRPVRFVVLAPRLDVIARRDAGRDKHFFELWRHLNDDLERWTDQPGLRLDTSEQDAVTTALTIRQRWDEALVAS